VFASAKPRCRLAWDVVPLHGLHDFQRFKTPQWSGRCHRKLAPMESAVFCWSERVGTGPASAPTRYLINCYVSLEREFGTAMQSLSGKRRSRYSNNGIGRSHDRGCSPSILKPAVIVMVAPLFARVAKGSRKHYCWRFSPGVLLAGGMELAAVGNGRTGSANRWQVKRAWPWQNRVPHITAAGNQVAILSHVSSDLRGIFYRLPNFEALP